VQLLGAKGDNNMGGSPASENSSYNSRQETPTAASVNEDVADDLPF